MKVFALGKVEGEAKGGGEGQGSSPGAVVAWRVVNQHKEGCGDLPPAQPRRCPWATGVAPL